MSIKKPYQDIVRFLSANADLQVSEILDEVRKLCESKSNTQTHVKNQAGEVIAVFCYFHKEWELVSECEYGSKASSTTGLNTMCKRGVNGWTKTQSMLKKADAKILEDVMSGKIDASEIREKKDEVHDKIRNDLFEEYALESEFYHELSEVLELVGE